MIVRSVFIRPTTSFYNQMLNKCRSKWQMALSKEYKVILNDKAGCFVRLYKKVARVYRKLSDDFLVINIATNRKAK